MGGAANVLGSVAGGFNQAHQIDQQRQFESEMDRRRQIGDFLGKLAQDETAHPQTRQAAIQEYLQLHNTPFNKTYKLDPNKLITPYQGPTQTATNSPAAAPPPETGGLNLRPPVPPPGITPDAQAQFTPQPETGVFLTPEALAQQRARQAEILGGEQLQHQVESAKAMAPVEAQAAAQKTLAEGEALGSIYDQSQGDVKKASLMAGKGIPYAITRPLTHAIGTAKTYRDEGYKVQDSIPDGQVVAATMLADGTASFTPTIVPGLLPKTQNSSSTDATGLTSNKRTTTTPIMPGLSTPTPPPTPASGSRKIGSATKIPPGVRAEIQVIGTYGLPKHPTKSQELAINEMKKQNINLELMASAAGGNRGDAARSMQPLLDKVMSDIQNNPELMAKIGPIVGRWSNLERMVGIIPPEARQLASELQSIYSFAVTMHGWRSAEAPKHFQDIYGGLEATPESLLGGLKAMKDTATAVAKVAYPGIDKQSGGGGAPHSIMLNGKRYRYNGSGPTDSMASYTEVKGAK